ncbi:cadherin-23-like isoform X2 [Crassostrea virginica]
MNVVNPFYLWIIGILISTKKAVAYSITEGQSSLRSCSSGKFLTFSSAEYYAGSCRWGATRKMNDNCNYPTSCTVHASNSWLDNDPCVGSVKTLTWGESCTDIWTAWTSWNCPSSCTSQTLTRTRTCNRPGGCSGSSTDSSNCLTLGCPRHGEWGNWDTWNSCTVTCGGGTSTRFRQCNNPSPYNGGNSCGHPGPYTDTETQSCNPLDCFLCGTRDYFYSISTTSASDSSQRQLVLMEDVAFRLSCCGVIKRWTFHASKTGQVDFQIWRYAGKAYTLIGQNSYTVPAGATGIVHTYQVPEFERISVQSGDLIGWYCSSNPVISYSSGNSNYPDNVRIGTLAAGDTLFEGGTYSWGSVSYTHDISYAIKVTTENSGSPYFVNMGLTFTVFDNTAVGSRLLSVSVWDPDGREEITVSPSTSVAFLNYQNGYIVSESTVSVGSYSLTLIATDTCQNTVTGTTSVKVINTPPVITNLPDGCLIHEDTKNALRLLTISTSDRQSDFVSCVMSSTSPSNGPFEVKMIQGTTDYGIFSLPNPSFNFDVTRQYDVSITCSDAAGGSDSGSYYVNIQKNSPPIIRNLPADITLVVADVHAGDVVYTVVTHDDENDTLTFTLSPGSAPFQILNFGDIQATKDLSEVFEAGFDLSVTVADHRTTIAARVLIVHLQIVNDVPLFGNLPLSKTWNVPENTPLGRMLYRVTVNDLDATHVVQYDVIFNPTTGSSYFAVNRTSGEVTTASSVLDYETVPSKLFRLIITASDGKDTSTATMTISVADENERCSFHQNQYLVTADEGPAGGLLSDAGFVILDEDSGSSHSYKLSCSGNSWRFSINSNTGRVSYSYPYDLDTELISSYNCDVTATDAGSLSCTTALVISISDINGNSPVFDTSEVPVYITRYETVGTLLVNLTATDKDISGFGDVTYRLDMSSYNFQYFDVTPTGTLFVNKELSDFTTGDTLDLQLTAVDYGGNAGVMTVRIVFYELNTTTTTTTEPPLTFIDSPWNTMWVTCLGVSLGAMACLTVYLFFTYTPTALLGWITTTVKKKIKIIPRRKKKSAGQKQSEKKKKKQTAKQETDDDSLKKRHGHLQIEVSPSPSTENNHQFPQNYMHGADLPLTTETNGWH